MTPSIFKYIVIICLISLNFNINSSSFAAKKKIVLAADYWCPYNCNPNDNDPGFLVELAKKIFSIYGIEVEYVLLPWSEALNQAEKGKIDGVIGISAGYSQDLAVTSSAQAKSIISAFTKPQVEWVYDGIDSLKGKRISIILDYNLTDTIRQYISANYPSTPEMFVLEDGANAVIDSINHLINDNVDLYIEDEMVVNYYLHKHNLTLAAKNAGRIDSLPLSIYIAFSKKIAHTQEYLKMLDEGMRSLTATGDIEDLKKKYKILY